MGRTVSAVVVAALLVAPAAGIARAAFVECDGTGDRDPDRGQCKGTEEGDSVIGNGYGEVIRALGGDIDGVQAGGGKDEIFGDGDRDILRGQNGDDTYYGGDGDDELTEDFDGKGNDRFFAGDGNDRVQGGPGTDRLFGGEGNESACGSAPPRTGARGCSATRVTTSSPAGTATTP